MKERFNFGMSHPLMGMRIEITLRFVRLGEGGGALYLMSRR